MRSYTVEELSDLIAERLPELRWLLRATDDSPTEQRPGGKFYAHIYDSPVHHSFEAVGDTPQDALSGAYNKALASASVVVAA